jgi:hypothetical protein
MTRNRGTAPVEGLRGDTRGGDKVRHRRCRGRCRCFGSDRTPGVAPQGVFRSRMVLPTVARWFVQGAREIANNDVQVRAA